MYLFNFPWDWLGILEFPIYVSTTLGDSMIVTHMYRTYSVLYIGFHTLVDLIIMDMLV